MTRAFIPLLKNNIRVMFGLSKDFKQRRKDIAIYVVLAILMLPILATVCWGLYYAAGSMDLQMVASTISSVMFMSEIVVLLFGVQSAISILFFAKDTEMLMAMPVTGLDIFVSKFLTIYMLHLGLAMIIQLPVMLAVGIGAGIKSVAYYLLGILGSILTPFIPLFVVAIIAVPLGYVISYFKRNNIVGTIFVLLLFAGFIGGYYYLMFALQSSAQSGNFDMEKMQRVMTIMSYIVYPNTYLANSMVATGLESFKNFAIFFAVITGLSVVTIAISAVLYKGSARRGLEAGNKKAVKRKDNEVKSLYSSLLIRDLKTCLGDTSSAINYLIGFVIVPMVLIMFSIMNISQGISGAVNTSVASIALIFGCGMNYFSIVAFSREGRQMDVLKMLPVQSSQIVNQKLMLASVYTLLMDVVILISAFIAKVHFMMVLMLFFSILFAGSAVNIIMIQSDLKAPNFVWNTNKELFKNNTKALKSMVLALPLVVISVVFIIWLDVIQPVSDNAALKNFIVMLPTLVVSVAMLLYALVAIYPKLPQLYENLEI